ncbi:hypothetical protein KDH_36320 [Dictyobacter sp. S3.2.2.5]|uniref:HTH cro/C1-type domain-containing protein n=1 Tax=Dictyobacter halimunensis TaxID=3026934 RepID=A0ABQ6FR97_9CHLR|nr:hypothetical protein KDH_36320 [Dictyobacter sp. S3.2.2.5]
MTPNRRLKQARELRGWSQAKVAELIGTDATTVSRWERGLFYPTPYFREKLCVLFAKNAEELGLLDTTCQPESTPTINKAGSEPATSTIVPLIPPSWSDRSDTFSYILHSAVHDHQAHILWEDAYVRALRGQHMEAQQLGEASMNAFERIGHLNAAAIREWLNQREFSSQSQASMPPLTPTTHTGQSKRAAKSFMHTIKSGMTLFLLLISIFAGIAFVWSRTTSPMAQSSAYAASNTPGRAKIAADTLNPKGSITAYATPTPVPTSSSTGSAHTSVVATPTVTPMPPAPVSTPTPVSGTGSASTSSSPISSLSAKVLPTSVNPQVCYAEPLGNRCTLTVWLFGSSNEPFTWSVSSNIPVQFNPTGGTGTMRQPTQIIAYVQGSPGQSGQFVFTFHTPGGDSTAISSWHG